jgi:DNA replication protein DnaC
VTESHASAPDTDGNPPAPDAAALERLAAEVERRRQQQPAERPEPERVDWQARVLQLAERTRPQRQQAERERTARQRRIDDLRRQRVIESTLDRLDRRFSRDVFPLDRPVSGSSTARAAIALARGQIGGFVLRGSVGVGKTYEAVAAYRWLVADRAMLPAVAVAVPALLDGLRPGREPVETLEAVESARLLLLDDLGAERASDWTAEVLYRVIDARYARHLPTIITTNATSEAVRANLGERVASRLNGLGMVVTLDGPDRRAPLAH